MFKTSRMEWSKKRGVSLLILSSCIVLGVATLLISRAATTTVSLEAEDGVKCNTSLEKSAAGASRGKYVRFSTNGCSADYKVSDWITSSTVPILNPAEGSWPEGSLGNFRFLCHPSRLNYDDPIVYPGQPGQAHLHMFFGNRNLNYQTNTDNITKAGAGSCYGGPLNRTGYWIPAVLDNNGKARLPYWTVFYYKSQGLPITRTHPTKPIQPYPAGLRMISGNMHATTSQNDWHMQWQCLDSNEANIYPDQQFSVFPNCPAGNKLKLQFSFPQCGARNTDGTPVLDSADHKSHLSYQAFGNVCPASHPIPYAEVSLNMIWNVTGSNVNTWKLSSDSPSAVRGASVHADWMMGWDETIMNTFITNCVNGGRNSNNGNLCNGTSLKAVSGPQEGRYTGPEIVDAPAPGSQYTAPSGFVGTSFP